MAKQTSPPIVEQICMIVFRQTTSLDISFPEEILTIDEHIVAFRGRFRFMQYSPKKIAIHGSTFWQLGDAMCRHVLSIGLYSEKEEFCWQSVSYNRYFIKLKRPEALSERNMTCDEAIKHNHFVISNRTEIRRGKLFSSRSTFSRPFMLLLWQGKQRKKPVIPVSSLYAFCDVFDDKKWLCSVMYDYQTVKSSIDIVEQCIGYDTVRRIN